LNEPILLLLTAFSVALLVLGILGGVLPRALTGTAVSVLAAAGAMLCLAALTAQSGPAHLTLPIAPLTVATGVVLDGVNAVFLFGALTGGAAIAATATLAGRSATVVAAVALALGGIALTMLAAGALPLAIGMAVAWAGLWRLDPLAARTPVLLAALLMLLAFSLCGTPVEGFGAIHANAMANTNLAGAAILGMAGAAFMLVPSRRSGLADALLAAGLLPAAVYLLTRLLADLPGSTAPGWTGGTLMLIGGAAAMVFGWRAAGCPLLDGSFNALVRQQVAVAISCLGIGITGQAADLPQAATLALAASIMLALGASVAGTLGSLAIVAMTHSAGTSQIGRLGGMMRIMPAASAGLAVSLFAFAPLPPSLGFAGYWLAFQALLAGPRTGGLLVQIPTALTAASLASSAALAAAGGLRLAGIAILGRPRGPRASAARDIGRARWAAPIALGALATAMGVLPGLALRALAGPTIRGLTGIDLDEQAGWLTLSPSATASGYAALPVLALVLLGTAGSMALTRRYRAGARLSASWNDGQPADPHLPFGEPMAQSSGTGFRPALPELPRAISPIARPAILRAGAYRSGAGSGARGGKRHGLARRAAGRACRAPAVGPRPGPRSPVAQVAHRPRKRFADAVRRAVHELRGDAGRRRPGAFLHPRHVAFAAC